MNRYFSNLRFKSLQPKICLGFPKYTAAPWSCTVRFYGSPSKAIGEVLTLPNGRRIGFHQSGPAYGTPIIYIHGHPDSGITITGPLETRVASELNVRWIGPDRPGVGLSSPYDSQAVIDYPNDVKALVKHLNLPHYYILGTSGGTGFALACTKGLPRSELKGVSICAGIGPFECGFDSMSEINRKAMEIWRDHPEEFRDYFESEYVPLAQAEDPAALADKHRRDCESAFAGKDRNAVLGADAINMAVAVFRQVWAQGSWAHVKGFEIHWKTWGYRLQDLGFPGIKLWYGGQDVNTTPVMGKYMAKRLEGSKYYEFPERSHYTIWQEDTLRKMIRGLIEG